MKHPVEFELALFASGDLGWPRRFALSRHLRRCTGCRRDVEAFRSSGDALREAALAFPRPLHWGKLAAEMKANIRLGLAAGEIAGPAPASAGLAAAIVEPWGWRPAAVMASMTLLAVSAYVLNRPAPEPPHTSGTEIVLKATTSGIELAGNGRAMALLRRDAESVTLTVGTQGSLRARYLNEDTGEVTIHNVYAQ